MGKYQSKTAKLYNAGLEVEKELNKLIEVRNLKLWESVALTNEVKRLMKLNDY